MNRLLVAVLIVQTLLLTVLVADRLVPVAHASDGMRCEIANWPAALTGASYDAIRVRVEEVRSPVPVSVQGWRTSDRVRVEP